MIILYGLVRTSMRGLTAAAGLCLLLAFGVQTRGDVPPTLPAAAAVARAASPAASGTRFRTTPDVQPPGQQPRVPSLVTRWAAQVTADRVLPEYPRPELARKEWRNLDG